MLKSDRLVFEKCFPAQTMLLLENNMLDPLYTPNPHINNNITLDEVHVATLGHYESQKDHLLYLYQKPLEEYYVGCRSVDRGFIMLKPTKIFGELRDI